MNPKHQANIPALQQYKRDLTNCDPLPEPTQRWMCPACDQQHINLPADMTNYRCHCGWHGDRDELLTAHDPNKPITFAEAGINSVKFEGKTYGS